MAHSLVRKSGIASVAAFAVLTLAGPLSAANAARSVTASTSSPQIVLTTKSSGTIQTVTVGSRIVVVLRSRNIDWSPPSSTNSTVVAVAHRSSSQNAAPRAVFVAKGNGTAQL